MANTKSAQKNARKNEIRRLQNSARRSALKTAIRKVYASFEVSKDGEQAQELLKVVAAQLARAKSKKLIHKNTAARKLSRLTKQVAAQNGQSPKPA